MQCIGRPSIVVVVVIVIGHVALKSIQSDPNSLTGVEIHRLTGRDDGTSRLDRHRAGHWGPLPKVVVGQMVLDQSVGMIDEVGRRKEADGILGPSAVVLGGLIEGCQIENGQTDHGLDVLCIHGMSTSEGRLGSIDLSKSVARQPKAHPRFTPTLLGEQRHGPSVHFQRPGIILLLEPDGRHPQQGRQDLPALLQRRFEEELGLIGPPGRQVEQPPPDPRHGEQPVDLRCAVELLVGHLAEVLVALLQILGRRGRGAGAVLVGQVGPAEPPPAVHLGEEGDARRRQGPDPVLVVRAAHTRLLPLARLPEEVGALDRGAVLHVQEGRVGPRRQRGILVGQDLGQGRRGDVGYLLRENFDVMGVAAAPVPRQGGNGNVQRRGEGGVVLQLLLRRWGTGGRLTAGEWRGRLRLRRSVHLHRGGFGSGRGHD
mmetsp:Transcript_33800/g.99597  ORF Transcript_33800/g.99597 Transcript_33800/m.99597 type:complete len:428 (-) Transcript_33800:86-1369(-)